MHRTITNLSKHLFSTFKSNGWQQNRQVYNNNLTFECGDVITKVILEYPGHKFVSPGTTLIKSFKCFSFKCIKSAQMYTKGSKYVIYSMNLTDLKHLLACNFHRGEKLCCTKFGESFKVQPLMAEKVKASLQIKSGEALSNTPQTIATHESQLKQLNVSIKTQNSEISFLMLIQEFEILKTVLWNALSQLYGLQFTFQMQRDRLVSKLFAGQITDENQQDQANFIL